jgi:acyl-[acyl-carrier-protein] desaturase
MLESRQLDSTGLEEAYYRLYRDFFGMAERRRRWSVADDIPWDKVNPHLPPEIANVVESFCAVELYLPDYIVKIMPALRKSRGRAFFHANWGYEEAKHSLALGDWLIKSGMRTEEQLADLETRVYSHDWNLPRDSPLGMVIYAMTQELATWLNYRNLRYRVDEHGDPALSKLLTFIATDERCHHDFYRRVAMIYLERDRESTLEEVRRVVHAFAMPALNMLADSRQREANVEALGIFSLEIFHRDVLRPLLESLGVSWAEFRMRNPERKSLSTTGMH